MTSLPHRILPPVEEEPDLEFDAELAKVDEDPEAHAIYQDTLARAALFETALRIRKSERLSQKQVAAAMGTTQSAVSDLESGRTEPQLTTIQRYARALRRRFDFTLSDERIPPTLDSVAGSVLLALTGTTLSPLLTTLVRQSQEHGQTLQALADAIALPKPLVRPLLTMLQAEGWTTSVGEGDEKKYFLVDEVANVIGVSIYQDRVVGVLINMDGDVLQATTMSLSDSSRETVVTVTAAAVAHLYHQRAHRRVLGVGVSVAGVVDAASGRIHYAPRLQNERDPWDGVDLEGELQTRIHEHLDAPDLLVAVENDANALAAWEYLRRGDDSVAVFLLSGVGIGAGVVVEGKLVRGAHSAAGEGGHSVVDPDGPECRAGLNHRGCLETMASAQSILAKLGMSASTSREMTEGLIQANERIRLGDTEAEQAFISAGHSLGQWLVATVQLLDPGRVVFYAHPHLAQHDNPAALAFMSGVHDALAESAGTRLPVVPLPRLEWHPLQENTEAVAAGAAALWHFLRRPLHWAPSLLADAPNTRELTHA